MRDNMQENWENRLAVVILNYNSSELTKMCHNHLRALSKKIKIVIVDNMSVDDSAKKLKNIDESDNTFLILNSSNTGYASGNNVGIRYIMESQFDVDTICIMNPDIIVEKLNDLECLYKALWEDDSLAVITAQTIYNNIIRQPNDFGWKKLTRSHLIFGGTIIGKIVKSNLRYNRLTLNPNGIAYVDIVQGCFFMAKKVVLSKVGLFDEGTFLYEEEAILGKKISDAGFREGVLPTVYIYHNHKEKESSLIKKSSKLFDMKCFYDSRKYYIRKFSSESKLFVTLSCAFLNIDYGIKKVFTILIRKD